MQAEEPGERGNDRVQSKQPRLARAENDPAAPRNEPAPARIVPPRAPATKPKRPFLVLAGVVLVGLAGLATYTFLTAGRQSTDDAQVAADVVTVSARVSGVVLDVAIQENQNVKPGDVIAQIDDREYVAKVQQAEADLESARAQSAQADAQVAIVTANSKGGLSSARAAYSGSSVGLASADAEVAAARARLVGARAEARQTESALKRAQELSKADAIAPAALDSAVAARDGAQAAVAQAEAQIAAAEEAKRAALARISEAAGRVAQSEPIAAQIAAATANAELARARIGKSQAELELAKLSLSYTKIVAPNAGVASQLSVRKGQLVTPGTPLVQIVPNETYVVANFKETQLSSMHVGQRARVEIDAYPHREFEGKVSSISSGTGASFALLPADNASGNFVKVVQRVPVRIAWVNPPSDVALRAGLSVDATVYVAP